MEKIIISGTVTLQTPYTTTPSWGKPAPGMPAKLPMMKFGGAVEQPYIPSSQFRRALRDGSFMAILDSIKARGGNGLIDLDSYYLNVQGGLTGKGEDSPEVDPQARLAIRASNPHMSLFGSFALAGKVAVNHGTPQMGVEAPQLAVALVEGSRVNDFARSPDRASLLGDGVIGELVERAQSTTHKSKAKAEIANAQAALRTAKKAGKSAAELAGLDARLAQAKKHLDELEAKDASNSISHPVKYHVISPMQKLSYRVVATNLTDEEKSILAAGLRAWAQNPVMGAKLANGCGEVSADLSLRVVNNGVARACGEIRILPDFGGIEVQSPQFGEWLQRFDDTDWSGKDFSAKTAKEVLTKPKKEEA